MASQFQPNTEARRERLARELEEALRELQVNRCAGVSVYLMHRLEAVEDALAELATADSAVAREFDRFRDELEELLYTREAFDEILVRGQRIASLLRGTPAAKSSQSWSGR